MDNVAMMNTSPLAHRHDFLGSGHARNERRTWAVVILCTFMMLLEIIGGTIFGSLALVADGWHMSTHAGALLLAAVLKSARYFRFYSERRLASSISGFFSGAIGMITCIDTPPMVYSRNVAYCKT